MVDPSKGNTPGTLQPESVFTKQRRIAELAQTHPQRVFISLNHYLDYDWLHQAYVRTRKDGAPGIDGVTAADYESHLQENLEGLLERLKSGRYRAPAVRRAYVPKGDGTQRPLGIPTFEDKVAQRALVMLLEPIYEQDFLDCSFGFRPGRSAHQVLDRLWQDIMNRNGRWILDLDISNYFGTIDHRHLRAVLDQRVKDGLLRRLIDKWLKAGVLEEGLADRPGRRDTPGRGHFPRSGERVSARYPGHLVPPGGGPASAGPQQHGSLCRRRGVCVREPGGCGCGSERSWPSGWLSTA